MVTGRDAFPSVSVGIGGSQKVELRSPRPALMYVYRAAAALPFTAQAQESVGLRRRTSRNHRPSKAEPLSIRSLSCGLSWAILRLADSHWIRSSTRPRATMWWLDLAYAPHLRPEGRRRLPLMRRGVFSVNFALLGGSKRGVP